MVEFRSLSEPYLLDLDGISSEPTTPADVQGLLLQLGSVGCLRRMRIFLSTMVSSIVAQVRYFL
jgi:hypothetical protein